MTKFNVGDKFIERITFCHYHTIEVTAVTERTVVATHNCVIDAEDGPDIKVGDVIHPLDNDNDLPEVWQPWDGVPDQYAYGSWHADDPSVIVWYDTLDEAADADAAWAKRTDLPTDPKGGDDGSELNWFGFIRNLTTGWVKSSNDYAVDIEMARAELQPIDTASSLTKLLEHLQREVVRDAYQQERNSMLPADLMADPTEEGPFDDVPSMSEEDSLVVVDQFDNVTAPTDEA